jgi:hypothetical protein
VDQHRWSPSPNHRAFRRKRPPSPLLKLISWKSWRNFFLIW